MVAKSHSRSWQWGHNHSVQRHDFQRSLAAAVAAVGSAVDSSETLLAPNWISSVISIDQSRHRHHCCCGCCRERNPWSITGQTMRGDNTDDGILWHTGSLTEIESPPRARCFSAPSSWDSMVLKDCWLLQKTDHIVGNVRHPARQPTVDRECGEVPGCQSHNSFENIDQVGQGS